ncbi:Nicotinate phosphoribosyltransferase [Spironucleus salmonicida]|nr:Nicotinate phosphoribosyltransferase [Spironucleus salmonicida]
MAYSYFISNSHNDRATFELFFRKNPFHGEYAIFAGIGQFMEFLVNFHYTENEINFLKQTLPNADPLFFEYLISLDYSMLTVKAPVEGQIVFANEPLLVISGPLGFVQLLETTALTLINFATLVTTNACRFRMAAHPEFSNLQLTRQADVKLFVKNCINSVHLLEFGLRRAQGIDGGLSASKYAMMGGFNSTSNIEAARRCGMLPSGTVAHSFIMSFSESLEIYVKNHSLGEGFTQFVSRCLFWRQFLFQSKNSIFMQYCANESELTSFAVFAYTQPKNFTVLVDTYNILDSGVHNFIIVALSLIELSYKPKGLRIDSGDLCYFSKQTRDLLDSVDILMVEAFKSITNKNYEHEIAQAKIVVSNDITEEVLYQLIKDSAKINAYGIGTHLVTCKSQPALGGVFKLVEKSGIPKMKLSAEKGKATIAGAKEVYRLFLSNGEPFDDLICSPEEQAPQLGEIIICIHPQDELLRVKILPAKVERLFIDYILDGKLLYPHKTDNSNFIKLIHKTVEEIRQEVIERMYYLRPDHKRAVNPAPYKVSLSENMSMQQRKISLESKSIPLIQ